MTAAGTRARVRAELTREIADVARRHLASAGAAALSLRAVARELGMASSAVYRYFPSRDDLLTALILDAYNALGEAAERAEAAVTRDDLRGRWHAACRAAREWAVAHPHEYALLYGSPVPGYAAPEATIAPGTRVGLLLCRVVADGVARGEVTAIADDSDTTLVPGLGDQLGLPPGVAARALQAWSGIYGAISFELFGQTHNAVIEHARFFGGAVDRLADLVGLP
ncbi:TetR/AcrR family transcriptional regulator [Pseudonocardia humida]|uniref:TetR/AcrR family transcriptional regulator n=1 Tax=Pseudonocardia humida TaxID=2800819 RepID=A0ABT1A5X4_9PSEU|nr:TetR/AcrR family transcriptional regulator [Pseudonocardia humida]MCO1658144.1 TetR/AcrR family transcriptional regulator [Pseudonocardia humida]